MMQPTAPCSYASSGFRPRGTIAVTCDHDLPLYAQSVSGKLAVVIRHAVIDVYERRGHIAVRAVNVVRGRRPAETRRPVALHRGFAQRCPESRWRNPLDQFLRRRWIEHIEDLHVRTP